jgi:hypothetical protein
MAKSTRPLRAELPPSEISNDHRVRNNPSAAAPGQTCVASAAALSSSSFYFGRLKKIIAPIIPAVTKRLIKMLKSKNLTSFRRAALACPEKHFATNHSFNFVIMLFLQVLKRVAALTP